MLKRLLIILSMAQLSGYEFLQRTASAQEKPLSSVYNEDQKFLDFFKVKDDKERISLKEYEKIQLQRKSSLLKDKKTLTAGDKKFVEKVDQELKLISMGYNPLRMVDEERARASVLIFKENKTTAADKKESVKATAPKLLKKKK
jgi:hypothetical protein